MKHLGEAASVVAIRGRLSAVQPDDPAIWGRMDAGQMICHLRNSFRMAVGEFAVAPVEIPIPRRVMKWMALRAPMQWPRNVRTVPELERGGEVLAVDFAGEHAAMLESFERFCRVNDNRSLHPFFGSMEPKDWMRWGYLHTDHHLRQFGR